MKDFDLRILLIEITQKCNARCDQCGSRCDINSEELLTKDEILNVLRDVKEHIGTDVMINITGGEPLMRKDLFEIMTEAAGMGFDWGMVTNGTLINDEVIRKMKTSGMKTITVSIDGMRETHEGFRHLPGSFDRIMTNLKKLQQAHFLDHLQVTFTANKKNVYEFPALYRELNRLKIDSIRTSCMDLIGRAQDFAALALEKQELKFLIKFINEVNQDHANVPVCWGCPHFLNGRVRGRSFECMAGISAASILYNGDIFACPNIPRVPRLIQGNIRTDRFSDVWKRRYQWYRTRTLPDYCSLCKYADRCKGDSVHSWDFEKNLPKFCYLDIFEPREAEYRKGLMERFPALSMEAVGGNPHAASIYLEPEAYSQIREYFHMGIRHADNRLEQQMVLVGFRLEHGYVIRYVLPSKILAKNSRISVFTPDTMRRAQEDVAALVRRLSSEKTAGSAMESSDSPAEKNKMRFLGFIHSHPVQKALQYSTGDEQIHLAAAVKYGDYIGILTNPSRDLIGAYYSRRNGKIRQGNLYLMTNDKGE